MQVAVVHLTPFGFQADVTHARVCVSALGNHHAIDLEGNGTIDAGDRIVIPLWARFGVEFRWEGAAAATTVDRGHDRAVDWENIPVGCVTPGVAVGVVENLHLDAAVKWNTDGSDVIGPNKNSRVASRHEVAPLELQNEILVHAIRAQLAGGLARAVQHVVANNPGGWGCVYWDPTLEVNAVEERPKFWRTLLAGIIGRNTGDQQ